MTVPGVSVNVPMPPGLARLFTLTEASSAALMTRGFAAAVLERLCTGTDANGRRLPASAHAAAVRLGLVPKYRKGVYVPSRVDRMIQANVVSVLHHLTSTGTLADSHPKVRAGVTKNLGRQVTRHLKDHPRTDITSLHLPMLQDTPVPEAPAPTAPAAMRSSPAPAATTTPTAGPADFTGTGAKSPQ